MAAYLRNCERHGPFRGGDACPECGSAGKLLMNDREIEAVGRILAGMLRHFPDRYGIRLNEHGWARIYTIVPAIKAQKRQFGWISPYHIEALAKTDPKERYQVNDRKEIRATYGHTIPIKIDDFPSDGIPGILYYQTTDEEMEFIPETGISPSDKTWVHLSSTYRKAYVAGLYHVDNPRVIGIDAAAMLEAGLDIRRATSDVYLTGEISPPVRC